jgi:hypothetical protein
MESAVARACSGCSAARGGRNRLVSLDCDFDLGSRFELYFVPLSIGQAVRNPNLSIKVIGAFDRDLGFLRLAGTGMRVNQFFDLPRECSSYL